MSIATLILGESGTGKTSSLRNMNPDDCLLIQSIKKRLPFKNNGWKYYEQGKGGNIFHTDDSSRMLAAMKATKKKVVIIDDFQYLMSNEYMRRFNEKGFERFNDIARHAWDVLMLANELPDDVRVYVLSHIQTDDFGNQKIKTIGKMLDEKITIEGLFTIVLKTSGSNNDYRMSTKNNGSDTVKSPLGLFEEDFIDNDLSMIDKSICDFFEINKGE